MKKPWAARQLGSDFVSQLTDEITYRHNLQLDLTEFCSRFKSHPTLGPVLRRWLGLVVDRDEVLADVKRLLAVKRVPTLSMIRSKARGRAFASWQH